MDSTVVGFIAVAAVIGVLVGVYASCYVYMRRFLSDESLKVVLVEWDRRLALASADERAQLQAQPPVEVLEAIFALPSARQWRLPWATASK